MLYNPTILNSIQVGRFYGDFIVVSTHYSIAGFCNVYEIAKIHTCIHYQSFCKRTLCKICKKLSPIETAGARPENHQNHCCKSEQRCYYCRIYPSHTLQGCRYILLLTYSAPATGATGTKELPVELTEGSMKSSDGG
jgi:hypothetical protein